MQVDLLDGQKGELTVTVDGVEVAHKSNGSMPSARDVKAGVVMQPGN